ncbi:hypothetical protein SAMN05216436_10198 [bacterium A37T11]|nr:hypothetical protein SAMN05216436_10198 [bacterium A37T11]
MGCNISATRRQLFRFSVLSGLLAPVMGLFFSCDKDKIDFHVDNSPPAYGLSEVRVVNLADYSRVVANGDTLTAGTAGVQTTYFQEDGLLGTVWRIQQPLFDDRGKLDLKLSDLYSPAAYIVPPSDPVAFTANTADGQMDYYTVWPGGDGQPWAVPVPRDETPPKIADRFKIRIVNLCKHLPGLHPDLPSPNGPMEDLAGSVTLTYADGTPVSPKTTDVSISQRVSEYVDVPYGTYQFRVLTSDGRQFSAAVHGVNERLIRSNVFDPTTSRMTEPKTTNVTGITYAPVMTFKAGGVYTIAVAPFPFAYPIAPGSNVYAYQNQFKIIEDRENPPQSLGRVQAVNAFPGADVSFRLAAGSVGKVFSGLAFGQASDYVAIEEGGYTIEALNNRGAVIATVQQEMLTSQNHSVWLYPDEGGQPQLKVVFNDLSGDFYFNRFTDDGAFNRYENTTVFATRFLNFCPDMPFVSVSIDNGQDMRNYMQLYANNSYEMHADNAMYNLGFAEPVTELPYVRWRLDYRVLFDLQAFRSKPGIKPGIWADDIPSLSSFNFIANPQLYLKVGRGLPTGEPGVYSVALVGRTGNDVPAEQRARMVIIKHTK